jgi:hypothetical protein
VRLRDLIALTGVLVILGFTAFRPVLVGTFIDGLLNGALHTLARIWGGA